MAGTEAASQAREDEDPEAERRRRHEELQLARLAAENAGINFDKKPRGDDESADEPMVLGRPLKGLRQKDIDPTEREAIMAEMFKRVRPLLERNIERAREREKKRREEEAKEHEEQRKQEQIRAERLLRRTEGIPVHLLSATASDFRSVGKTASSYDAPHGGDIADDTMRSMENLIVRVLRARNAIEGTDGERVTAAEVKVMMARAGAKATTDASRTRWEHAELGEALGFVLAVCSLERAGKIVLKRSDKYPEAVDLAAMRLVRAGARGGTGGPRRRRRRGESRGVGADGRNRAGSRRQGAVRRPVRVAGPGREARRRAGQVRRARRGWLDGKNDFSRRPRDGV